MNSSFEKPLQTLLAKSDDLWGMVDELTDSQASFKSDESAWSVNEVLEHLLSIQELAATWLPKWLDRKAEHSKEAGLANRARSITLVRALLGKRRFKVPEGAVKTLPTGMVSLNELRDRWKSSVDALQSTLEMVPVEYENREAYRHPLAGWLNLTQMLTFMSSHIQHHMAQVTRIVESEGFPTS